MSVSVESYRVEPGSPTYLFLCSDTHLFTVPKDYHFFHKQKTSSCVCVLQVLSPQPGTCFHVVHYYSSSDPAILSP